MLIESKHFDQYVMVAPGSDYGIAMWSDLKKVDNVIFLDYVINTKSRLIRLCHHLHFSFGVNKKIQLPFQSIWKKKYSLEEVRISSDKKTCIIFTDVSACRTDAKYLKNLHKMNNVTMVMVLVNVMNSKNKLIANRLDCFDQIYSFDKHDCDKYGFIYHPTIYSVTRDNVDSKISESDAFFVGVSKGNRHEFLKKLYQKIHERGGQSAFYISGVKNNSEKLEGICYDRWLSYKNVIEHLLKTNCIVEIMGPGQSGLTLRAMEAIVYNKKLLTNNESITSLRFYNSGFIKYFENVESVDIDFLINHSVVDYKYDGEFSPIHLLEKINEIAS